MKSTRDFVAFSELPATPSGGFFQGISFPEISTRPPLGRTELQAAKQVHTSKGDSPREPPKTTALAGKGQMQKLAQGGSLLTSSRSGHGSRVERRPSSSQHELTAMVSTAASPSVIKETTTTYCQDIVENIYHGGKSGTQPFHAEKASLSDQFILSSEREVLEESRRSQVLSPPLAQAIRDYVNSLLVQGGVSSLPGTSNSIPTLDIEKICKRIDLSEFQETESPSPQKLPRLGEKAVGEGDPRSFVASQSGAGSAQMSASAKTVVSHSLTTLGIEMSEQSQHGKVDASELSFPLHESILKVIEEEWQQIDRQIPSLACKYPVSSKEATRILAVPKVDDEILCSISEAAPPAGPKAASAESCAKHVDLALCRAYEAAASALQTATHTAFVAKALQADISQAAQMLSSDPSYIPRVLEILSKTYDAASFLCETAFDEVKMAACTMASSTAGRRHLWLKDCKLSPASKNKLTVAPFRGSTLFGGEVHKIMKKHGNKQ